MPTMDLWQTWRLMVLSSAKMAEVTTGLEKISSMFRISEKTSTSKTGINTKSFNV
jgi:hypothetical protein